MERNLKTFQLQMFLPHESGYSVVVYDWLRKHYAKADKMRESGQTYDMPLVSFEECKWDKISLSFRGQPKIKLNKVIFTMFENFHLFYFEDIFDMFQGKSNKCIPRRIFGYFSKNECWKEVF